MANENEIKEGLGTIISVHNQKIKLICFIEQVDEPEFGCEGRPDNQPIFGKLVCIYPGGRKTVNIEEKLLWKSGLDDQMWIGKEEGQKKYFAIYKNNLEMLLPLETDILDCIMQEKFSE